MPARRRSHKPPAVADSANAGQASPVQRPAERSGSALAGFGNVDDHHKANE